MNKKGFASIVFIILLAAISIGAVAFLVTRNTNKLSNMSWTGNQTQAPEPTASVDTTGWQTHTNSAYGYTIQYPPDWNVEIFDDDRSGITITNTETNSDHVGIAVQNVPLYVADATKYEVAFKGHKANLWANSYYEIPLKNGKYLVVTFYSSEQHKNIVSTIVSTFEFTDLSETSTEDDEFTYTCPESSHVTCKPPIDSQKPECSQEFISWAEENCKDFSVAY